VAALPDFERASQRLARVAHGETAVAILVEECARLAQGGRAELWLRQADDVLHCQAVWPAGPLPDADRRARALPHAAEALARRRPVCAVGPSDGAGMAARALWTVPLVAADDWLGLVRVVDGVAWPALGPLLAALARRHGLLVNIAAHDLRNVVTSLKGYAHLLERHLAQQPDERPRRWAAVVQQQVNALVAQLADLTEVGRVASGRRPLEPERLDLRAVVEEAVATVSDRAPRVVLPAAPVLGQWDAARLRWALGAALRGALADATEPATLRAEPAPEGPVLLLLPDVGEASAAADWCEAAGLELLVARALVEAHGGQMACWQTPQGRIGWRIALPWQTAPALAL
jgi:signal transduction histidine kinase